MTEKQKEAYRDCVIYLRNYATAMENDANIAKFCYDIAKKAQFLYNLRAHLFNPKMKEELEEQIEKYKNKVPREGICIRKVGDHLRECFKLKTQSFKLKEALQYDEGEVDIEAAQQ